MMATSSSDQPGARRARDAQDAHDAHDAQGWSLLSHHVHVLLCIDEDPDLTLREIAARIGLTERATHRLVDQLVSAGALTREREGRRNHYEIVHSWAPNHPLERGTTLGDLLLALSA